MLLSTLGFLLPCLLAPLVALSGCDLCARWSPASLCHFPVLFAPLLILIHIHTHSTLPPSHTPAPQLMAFSGPAPELINGRLSMLAFVAALGAELASGEPVLRQLSEEPTGELLTQKLPPTNRQLVGWLAGWVVVWSCGWLAGARRTKCAPAGARRCCSGWDPRSPAWCPAQSAAPACQSS